MEVASVCGRIPIWSPPISAILWLASLTASTSRPLSVSSRIANLGRSMAIWRISARFISPPEKPSLTYRRANSVSMRSCFIFSFMSLRNSRMGINSSPSLRSGLRTLVAACRKKSASFTPGIAIGRWNAIKMPARARSEASHSNRLSPLMKISPEVTSYLGWPMMAFPSVLLPEPLGPISACVSPRLISRLTPLRIGLPSTATCKS